MRDEVRAAGRRVTPVLFPAVMTLTIGLGAAPVSAAHDPVTEDSAPVRVFTIKDPRVSESSGLVDAGRWMMTVNDSGNPAEVFTLDSRTGRVRGVTRFAAKTIDVEAMAPAGPGAVYVGDTGGNAVQRAVVEVYRLPAGPRDRTVTNPRRFTLRYPDGAHDCESMFVGPEGRLYFVTKGIIGGGVYASAAPATELSGTVPNPLVKVGSVQDFATDAAAFSDGTHVIVRGYTRASVYTVPDFQRVGSFSLPPQVQGEAISVGPGDRLRLSSEGVGQPVLQVPLPAEIAEAMRGSTAEPVEPDSSTSPSPDPSAMGGERGTEDSLDAPATIPGSWLLVGIPAMLVLGAAAIGLALTRRSRAEAPDETDAAR